MNQKKCPKCGEMNPAEAVMCWACYTPLTGGAVAAGGGAAAMSTPGVLDDENKKAIPPWQLGVVGLALLLGVGFGISQFMGGTPVTEVQPNGPIVQDPNIGGPGPAPPPPPIPMPGGDTRGTTPLEVRPAPYTMVSPPNPNSASKWGVMAIVPKQQNISATRAASLAAAAGRRFKGGTWGGMHIYVFADTQSAAVFSKYQIPRRSEVLSQSDYASPELLAIWPRCLARYEMKNGKESVKLPMQAPSSWWYSRR